MIILIICLWLSLVIYLVGYHLIFIMFIWTYWQTIFTKPKTPLKEVSMSNTDLCVCVLVLAKYCKSKDICESEGILTVPHNLQMLRLGLSLGTILYHLLDLVRFNVCVFTFFAVMFQAQMSN